MYTLLTIINDQPYLIILFVLGLIIGGIWGNTYLYNRYLIKKMNHHHQKYHGLIPPIMNKLLIGLGTIIIVLCFFIYPMFTKVILPTSMWYDNSNPDIVLGFMNSNTNGQQQSSYYRSQLSDVGMNFIEDGEYTSSARYIEIDSSRYYLIAWSNQLWMISKDGLQSYTKISSTIESLGLDHEPTEEEMEALGQKSKELTRQQNLSKCVDLGNGIMGFVEIRIHPLPDVYYTKYVRDKEFLVDYSFFIPKEENGITNLTIAGTLFDSPSNWFMYEATLAGPNPYASEALDKYEYYSTQVSYKNAEYTPEEIANSIKIGSVYLSCQRNGETVEIGIDFENYIINEFE